MCVDTHLKHGMPRRVDAGVLGLCITDEERFQWAMGAWFHRMFHRTFHRMFHRMFDGMWAMGAWFQPRRARLGKLTWARSGTDDGAGAGEADHA